MFGFGLRREELLEELGRGEEGFELGILEATKLYLLLNGIDNIGMLLIIAPSIVFHILYSSLSSGINLKIGMGIHDTKTPSFGGSYGSMVCFPLVPTTNLFTSSAEIGGVCLKLGLSTEFSFLFAVLSFML